MVLSNNGYKENSLTNQKDGFYGRFGGPIIYGLMLAFLVALTIYHLPHILFLDGYIGELFISFLIILPIVFSAALSVRTKGLDLSVLAMIAIASMAIRSTESMLLGVVLALALCIAIGAINAVVIHYLKLPGLLVTFITLMLSTVIINFIQWESPYFKIESVSVWTYIFIAISAVLAVLIAIISSRSTKKRFWTSLFPVYAGSGVLAVLYVLAYSFAGERGVVHSADSYLFLLFAGVFFSITRFSKNKVLALVLSLLPCLIFTVANGLFNFFIDNYINFGIFVLVMLVLIFNKGRAELIGYSHEKGYRARGWIALIPVILLIIKDIVSLYSSYAASGASKLGYILNNITVDIMLVIVAVGMGVLYFLNMRRHKKQEE